MKHRQDWKDDWVDEMPVGQTWKPEFGSVVTAWKSMSGGVQLYPNNGKSETSGP